MEDEVFIASVTFGESGNGHTNLASYKIVSNERLFKHVLSLVLKWVHNALAAKSVDVVMHYRIIG